MEILTRNIALISFITALFKERSKSESLFVEDLGKEDFSNRKPCYPCPAYASMAPNDRRCNSSSTETGVLVAITGHCPTSPGGVTYYHWRKVTQSPPLLYFQENLHTYPVASHPRTRGAPRGGGL
ncbi:hypothetical protein AVEN_76263-1 [Araneus ventricosus]|uniref:Uncharacterized protein n=1 Tax=Araneus ventricosus TaxID=182803 RepID=A0A4Y2LZG1_ARAVE|nr:hypothetical protein AVEN_76263-1 [Araneus ventricosus]